MYKLGVDEKKLSEICRRNGVEFLGVFGSVARGKDQPRSDVDLLVRFGKKGVRGLMGIVAMERQLEDLLGRKVDLVTEGFLSPYFRDSVLKETKPVYGKT